MYAKYLILFYLLTHLILITILIRKNRMIFNEWTKKSALENNLLNGESEVQFHPL